MGHSTLTGPALSSNDDSCSKGEATMDLSRRPHQSTSRTFRTSRNGADLRLAASSSLVTLLLIIHCAGSVSAQRNSNDILIGEDADNYYYMSASKYKGSVAEKAGVQFCRANLTATAEQNAVRQLGFNVDAERYAMFEQVGKDQQAALIHNVYGAMFDQGLESTSAIFHSASSLNPWNVNQSIKMLENHGFANTKLLSALRTVARQNNKPAMYAAFKSFTEQAKTTKEGWDTGSEMAKDPGSSQLRLLVGALKTMQGNPELGLVVTTAEFGENVAYLAYASRQVTELSQASDNKLSHLASLSQQLKTNVDQAGQAKRTWRKSTGYNSAHPVCTS